MPQDTQTRRETRWTATVDQADLAWTETFTRLLGPALQSGTITVAALAEQVVIQTMHAVFERPADSENHIAPWKRQLTLEQSLQVTPEPSLHGTYLSVGDGTPERTTPYALQREFGGVLHANNPSGYMSFRAYDGNWVRAAVIKSSGEPQAGQHYWDTGLNKLWGDYITERQFATIVTLTLEKAIAVHPVAANFQRGGF